MAKKREPKVKVQTEEKWMQDAVARPGAFTEKAKRAGVTVAEYAEEKADAPGRLGKQARLAQTFRKMARKRKKK